MFSFVSDLLIRAFVSMVVYIPNSDLSVLHTVRVFGVTLPRVLGMILADPKPDCSAGFVQQIVKGVSSIIQVLIGLGISISIIGIVAGGLMRATSFGNERRIAMSNTAITCAVVGLLIVLFGATVGNAIPGWFNIANADDCKPSSN